MHAGLSSDEPAPIFTYDKPGAYIVSLVAWNKESWAGRPAQKTIFVKAN